MPFSVRELIMSVIPSLLERPAASTECTSADVAVNLVIENFDEFAAGAIFLSSNGCDYFIGTALATAYN